MIVQLARGGSLFCCLLSALLPLMSTDVMWPQRSQWKWMLLGKQFQFLSMLVWEPRTKVKESISVSNQSILCICKFSSLEIGWQKSSLYWTDRTLNTLCIRNLVAIKADLPTPAHANLEVLKKKAQKNLEIRTSNLETSKICVKLKKPRLFVSEYSLPY